MMQTCVPEPNSTTSKLADLAQLAWPFTSSSSMSLSVLWYVPDKAVMVSNETKK